MFIEDVDALIEARVDECIEKDMAIENVHDTEYIASETFGEVLDKLIITHIRIWNLVDRAAVADEEDLPAIYNKIKHCVNVKRPKLVTALNKMFEEIVRGRWDLVDDEYVKAFKNDSQA